MQFLLLICLMVVCLPIDWPRPPGGTGTTGGLVLTALTAVGLLFAAGLIALVTTRRLERRPEARSAIAHWYGATRTYYFFAQLAGYALCLWWFGWGWTARRLGEISWHGHGVLAPFGEFLVLAPFVLVQAGSWCFFYDVDREFHRRLAPGGESRRYWSRAGYVLFHVRQQLILVFAPLALLMGQQGLDRLYPELMRSDWAGAASLLVLPAFLIFFPAVLPALLGLRPMPPGPVRARLEAHARRLRFRYSQIYLWDTRGGVANAMIVGVLPRLRYVVLTDRLLEELTEVEVDAVFGHEVGHAKHGHIVYYGLFLILSVVALSALTQALLTRNSGLCERAAAVPFDDVRRWRGSDLRPDSDREPEDGTEGDAWWRGYRTPLLIAPVGAMAVYMFAVFGFISRRCERQADVFGCRAVSCALHSCRGHDTDTVYPEGGAGLCRAGIDAFVRALRRVEDVNGMTRPVPRWRGVGLLGKANYVFRLLTGWLHTWQHSTIPKRMAFLERVAEDPRVERRFQRRVWVLKWAVILGLAAATVALGLRRGWEVLWVAL